MLILCWYQSLWNKTRHSQKPTLLLNSLFILWLLACVHMRWEYQMGADPRLWVPPPRNHGAPPFQWKQVGSPHSANHAASRSGRRVPGRRQGRYNLSSTHSPQEKSGKHVCRPVAQFPLAYMRGSGVPVRVSSGAEGRWGICRVWRRCCRAAMLEYFAAMKNLV